jgi:hypothetical protein
MKRVIAFIIVLVISNMAFAQQDFKSDTIQNSSVNKKSPAKRYQGIIETGYSWGLGEWGQSVFRFNVIVAIRLPHYSIGIGTGFSILNQYQYQFNGIRFDYQVPIFLDNRIYFSNKRIRPYLAFGIGLSIVTHDMQADRSLFLNSSTGIFWKISDKISLIIGIVYESYKIGYGTYSPPYYLFSYFNEKSNSLGINIGISF